MNADLVVFGEDWGRHPSSTQHLIARLLGDRKVLWVNSIGLRRPRLTAGDVKRLICKARSQVSSLGKFRDETHSDTPTIIEPKTLPFPGNRLARIINRRLLGSTLAKVMRRTGIERPILWTSLPSAVDFVGTLDERAVVYYCGDDFGSLTGVDHEAVTRLESRLVERADLILAASPALAAKFPPHKTRLLPHGADLDLFQTPVPRAPDLPEGRPVAGFYGSISDWVDMRLIADVASLLPEWFFVLIGPIRTDVEALRELGNVAFLGERPHTALPGYAQHWDASLLPFRDTPQIRSCNPLKLREYLAAGRPVVATDFPALDGYRDVVRVATDPRSFASALEDARGEGSARRLDRRRLVQGESWDARAQEASNLMRAL